MSSGPSEDRMTAEVRTPGWELRHSLSHPARFEKPRSFTWVSITSNEAQNSLLDRGTQDPRCDIVVLPYEGMFDKLLSGEFGPVDIP